MSPRKELNKIVKDIGGMLDTELTVETTVEVRYLIYMEKNFNHAVSNLRRAARGRASRRRRRSATQHSRKWTGTTTGRYRKIQINGVFFFGKAGKNLFGAKLEYTN